MFLNRLPAVYLIPIILILTLICLYYAFRLRRGDKKYLFPPIILSALTGIAVIFSKLYGLLNSTGEYSFIVDMVAVFFAFFTIISVIVIGIKQCRKGQIDGQRKRLLFLSFAVIGVCLVFFAIRIVIAIIK